jgi:small-conductance mechanosensitive channel
VALANKTKSPFLNRHIWSIVLILFSSGAKLLSEFLPDFTNFSEITTQKWVHVFDQIFVATLVLLIFRLIYKFTSGRIAKVFDEQEEQIFYSKIYGWVLFTIGAFIVLNLFGLSLNNITLFIGIITTGLAFALREVLLSFIGWLILLRKKPFRIGDHIRIGDEHGKVIHIGTYYVILDRTSDIPDDFTRIPNRFFLEKSIQKLGKNRSQEKLMFRITERPDNKDQRLEKLETIIREIDADAKLLSSNFDVQDDRLYLVVNVLVPFDNKAQCRSRVVEATLDSFGEFIYFPKE